MLQQALQSAALVRAASLHQKGKGRARYNYKRVCREQKKRWPSLQMAMTMLKLTLWHQKLQYNNSCRMLQQIERIDDQITTKELQILNNFLIS